MFNPEQRLTTYTATPDQAADLVDGMIHDLSLVYESHGHPTSKAIGWWYSRRVDVDSFSGDAWDVSYSLGGLYTGARGKVTHKVLRSAAQEALIDRCAPLMNGISSVGVGWDTVWLFPSGFAAAYPPMDLASGVVEFDTKRVLAYLTPAGELWRTDNPN